MVLLYVNEIPNYTHCKRQRVERDQDLLGKSYGMMQE